VDASAPPPGRIWVRDSTILGRQRGVELPVKVSPLERGIPIQPATCVNSTVCGTLEGMEDAYALQGQLQYEQGKAIALDHLLNEQRRKRETYADHIRYFCRQLDLHPNVFLYREDL